MPNLQMPDIKLEPIRRYAEAYGMNKPLPKTEYEAVAYLYEFGFRLFGGMEEIIERSFKLEADLLRVAALPITYAPNRIVEVPANE